METALSSPNSSIEVDKPRAPRFEAYVMTGDAILNLSRTTTSPEYLPVHSKRRSVQQQPSNSVPTSPSEQTPRTKAWEPDTPAKSPVSSLVRNSKSEEALVIHMEKEPANKPSAEERTFSHSTLVEGVQEAERIVWTYNAPLSSLTEKELRRYEADQFWLSTRTETSFKQTKQIIKLEETTAEVKTERNFISSNQVTDSRSGCDSQNGSIVAAVAAPSIPVPVPPLVVAEEPIEEEEEDEPEASIDTQHKDTYEENPASPIRPPLTRSSTDEESDADSLQSVHYSPKGVDMPSAIRLAKRWVFFD